MKKKRILIVGVSVAILIGMFFFAWTRNDSSTRLQIYGTKPKIEVEEDTGILGTLNSGNLVFNNACGVFGDKFFGYLMAEEFDPLYDLVNMDVLMKYGYIYRKEAMEAYWKRTINAFPTNPRAILFDIIPSTSTSRAIIANYCIVGEKEGSIDSETYDYSRCIWLSLTVYFGEDGEIVSMIPCSESSIDSYALNIGLERR